MNLGHLNMIQHLWWLGGRALDLRLTGRGFNFRLVRFHLT